MNRIDAPSVRDGMDDVDGAPAGRRLDDQALAVLPGPGLVHRGPGVVLVVPGPPRAGGLVEDLLRLCAPPLDPTGRRTVRAVAALLAHAEPDDVPAFALLAGTRDGVVAVAHGAAEVVVPATSERLRGGDSLAWAERLFTRPVEEIRVAGCGDAAAGATGGLPFDLQRGTVPGCGVVLRPRAGGVEGTPPAPAPVTPAALPVVARVDQGIPDAGHVRQVHLPPDDGVGDSLIDAPAQAAPPAPGPLVEGTLCARGHFTDPNAAFCATCGISMQQRTAEIVTGPRPALGVLVLDDGAAYTLDGDHVIGRDPGRHPDVAAGLARPLVLDDEVGSISRVHAALRLDGWRVRLVDEGAANGTSLTGPDGRALALTPHEPVDLHSGARLRIGRRVLAFHSYHAGGERP